MCFFKHVQTIIPHLSSVPKALAANPWLKDSSTDQLIMTSNIVMMNNEASCYDSLKPKFPGIWNSIHLHRNEVFSHSGVATVYMQLYAVLKHKSVRNCSIALTIALCCFKVEEKFPQCN